MNRCSGIDAPAEVSEGSSGPIELSAPNSKQLIISNLRTGEEIERSVDSGGNAHFELPNNWLDGDVIVVVDKADPTISTTVNVTPGTAIL